LPSNSVRILPSFSSLHSSGTNDFIIILQVDTLSELFVEWDDTLTAAEDEITRFEKEKDERTRLGFETLAKVEAEAEVAPEAEAEATPETVVEPEANAPTETRVEVHVEAEARTAESEA